MAFASAENLVPAVELGILESNQYPSRLHPLIGGGLLQVFRRPTSERNVYGASALLGRAAFDRSATVDRTGIPPILGVT